MSEIQIGIQEQTLKPNKSFLNKKKKKSAKFNKVAAISWALLYFVLIWPSTARCKSDFD
jgi:hypothetical protein